MFDVSKIKLGGDLADNLFSEVAENAAKYIKIDPKTERFNKDNNKSTQLRKFYDELSMWNDKVQFAKEKKDTEYQNLVPFIKMLKAKVAYAEGRKHINQHFSDVFNQCIDEIHSADTLRYAKLFMEAVMGYCKLEETKSNSNR